MLRRRPVEAEGLKFTVLMILIMRRWSSEGMHEVCVKCREVGELR